MDTTAAAGTATRFDRARPIAVLRPWLPPIAVAAAGALLLLVTAGGYGMHRDEMYFIVSGRHPDWGYADQPPLTPLLTAGSAALFGATAAGIRMLPALVYAAAVLVTALTARDLGGGRRAQGLAALVLGVSGYLVGAHLSSTATYDVLGWAVVTWLVVRLLGGADPRLWLATGIAAGITLENKNLLLFLAAGLAFGLVVSRRFDVFRTRWLYAGAAIAFAIWLPNLAWQAAHGWPQLEMAKVIGQRSGDENRTMLVPMQLIFAGPLLFPVMLSGLWWLVRASAGRPWRAIGWSYLAVLALLFLTRGKGYYAGGLLPVLIAAGSIPLDGWLARGRRRLRGGAFTFAATGSFAIVAVLALPILPLSSLGATPVSALNSDVGNTVGWPELVSTVTRVADGLSPADRAHAFIFTINYGEAGALQLMGSASLPPVYSGHNSYADWGPPPDSATIAIVVATWDEAPAYFAPRFGPCERKATIDNGVGVDSEEQGASVWICRDRTRPWSEVWPELRHLS